MAKTQPEASSKKKEKKKAKRSASEDCVKDSVQEKKKKKRSKDEPEMCVSAADATEVKKKKKKTTDTNGNTAFISRSSDELTSLEEAQQPSEGKTACAVEDDLTPEEKRVLERKLKKIRRKEEKKKLKEEMKSKKEESKNVAQTQALEYLKCWSEKREQWKFQKTRQVWLLQHMYDSEKVSDAHFAELLMYIEGLRGVARETTVQKAEALVRGDGQEEPEGGANEALIRAHRAKEIIQILS